MPQRSIFKRMNRLLSAAVGLYCTVMPIPMHAGAPYAVPAQAATAVPVYILLWFHTENYIHPASDDAALRIATMLTTMGVPATFKIVGEKARVLERRGRTDVIQALARHDIGYHSNWHSRHPTTAEYLDGLDWDTGVDEFYHREHEGVEDIRRIFGVDPSCWAQPAGTWGPQTYPALLRMGICVDPVGPLAIGIHDQPFWYCGVLCAGKFGAEIVRVQLGKSGALQEWQQRYQRTYDRLQSSGGGIISIGYHPCEFIHKEFWDVVNFSGGRNPLPHEWKLESLKSPDEIEQAFDDFRQSISYIQKNRPVRFITAREMLQLYPDTARERVWLPADIARIAEQFEKHISFQQFNGTSLSAAEILSLLARMTIAFNATGRVPPGFLTHSPLGPVTVCETPPPSGTADWGSIVSAAGDIVTYAGRTGRLPPVVWVNGHAISPVDFGATLGAVVRELIRTEKTPETVPLKTGTFTPGDYVTDRAAWNWPPFPEGFHPARVVELARLQTWSLKPAILMP